MARGTRSHSPPLPPNATYNHPIIALNILPSAKLFTAGSKVSGVLEVICKERNSVALGQLAIEFFGIEELKLLDHSAQSSIHGPHKCIFQGPALPPSNAVASSEAPIGGHYYTALRGRTKFPFSFPLPSKLPSSTNFNDKARVCYALKATCQVLSIESRQNVLVTKSRSVQVVEKLLDWNDTKYHEPIEIRGELRDATGTGAGVWAEVKIDKTLHYNQNSSQPEDGLIRAQLTVKNNSRRTLSGGVNAKICRRLVLPQDPSSQTDPSRVQVVRNCTFRGIDYEFPSASGQAKTVKLICQLPSPTEEDLDHADHNSSCLSVRGIKLFSVEMFLRVELELGALSNDLIIDLPIYVAHPSSLPKELLLRNSPTTIEHVPSPNPISISHLTKPDSSSGRASRNTSRSSSPHPPSLQPGNISRSTSPRLSLATVGDWGGMQRSAPPSPAGSAHFSPFPSRHPSPLPSPSTSSSMPFSPSSILPTYHPPTPGAAPGTNNYFAHSAPWPNHSSAPYPADHISFNQPAAIHPLPSSHDFSSYPQHSVTPTPTQDHHRSYVEPSSSQYPPPPPQPIFSPPSTPWHQQTPYTTTHIDPPSTYAPSTPQPDHSYQANNEIPHVPPYHHPPPNQHPQEPFSPSAYQGYDVGSPMAPNWRTRHQSLPTAPAPPPHHYRPPGSQYDGENVSDQYSALSRKSSNSRRTSEPIKQSSGHDLQQRLSGGITVRKRALPTPPQVSQVADPIHHSSDHSSTNLCNTPDYRQPSPASVSNDPPTNVQHSRLETIGEVGESRPGTLSANLMSQNTLDLLARSDTSDDEDDEPRRHPRRQEAVRVVSHPRGMRPRRSDGSDSVQALEDIVAMQDERRTAQEGSPDQTPTQNNERAVFPDSSQSNQQENQRPAPRLSSQDRSERDRSSSSPHLHSSSRSTHSTGLANLVQFLNRATSTEPPRASSAQDAAAKSHSGNLSVDQSRDPDNSISGQSTEDKMARTPTPSYTGSALRIKSTRISYGETLIDAVPSPTSVTKSCSTDLDRNVTASSRQGSSSETDWKPPAALADSSSRLPRTSIAEQMDFCDDPKTDEVPVGRESIAPEALFPQFESGQPLPATAPAITNPPSLPEQPVKLTTCPVNATPPPPSTTGPLFIPSDSPTVKKKGFNKTQRKPSQPSTPKKLASDKDSYPSPSRIAQESAPASLNISVQPQPTTIVERLRSQNVQESANHSRQAIKDTDPSTRDATVTRDAPRPSAATTVSHGLGLAITNQTDLGQMGGSQRHVADARPTQTRPSLPKPPMVATAPINASTQSTASLFSSNKHTQESTIPRLSAIPKSSTPLSLTASSLYSSNSTPHRPLPISPGCAHEARMSSLNRTPDVALFELSAKEAVSHRVAPPMSSTNSLVSSSPHTPQPPSTVRSERASSQVTSGGRGRGLATDSLLAAPCSPTSPTNLSRKSRIKRQISSTHTHTTARDSVCLSSSDINRLPGGWNDEESNEIEQQLIEALKQTNLAVQKATSRRLSTPEFVHSPAKNRCSYRSSMYSTRPTVGGGSNREAGTDRENCGSGDDPLRANMSVPSRSSMEGTSVEREYRSGSQTDESMTLSYDEDVPIPLTSGEYKSMRGGRGGRVSSVVGQWAKLAGVEGSAGMVEGRKPSTHEQKDAPLIISTRALSIRPKKAAGPGSTTITGLLSRNSSLTSQFSCARGKQQQEPDSLARSPLVLPARSLLSKLAPPPLPASSPLDAEEQQQTKKTVLGYRNLANRLSKSIEPSSASPFRPCSESSESISSLASSLDSHDEPASIHPRPSPLLSKHSAPLSAYNNYHNRVLPSRHTLPPSSSPAVVAPPGPVAAAGPPLADRLKRWQS